MQKIIGDCPIDPHPLDNHRLWRLASVPPNGSPTVTELRDRIARHDWTAAHEILRFDPMSDTWDFQVVSCPVKGKMALVSLYLTFEPLSP
ncbi:MAG: hypothetical protein ACREMY_12280, partial [bacterium]